MAKVQFAATVTLDELRHNLPIFGPYQTAVIQSEPGCGKTSLLKMLEEDMGSDEYDFIYVDCPVKSLEEIGMSVPVHDTKQLEYYVSELFKLGNGKKKVILLDEVMKAPKLLQIIFMRLMLEGMVGDRALPCLNEPGGSFVFATSNNQSDGVGDGMLAHGGNRVTFYRMQKPNAGAWLPWAGKNGISRSIRAWVAMNQRCLASYLDGGQEDNPYIFKPSSGVLSFVSPRSLARSDVFVKNLDRMGLEFVKASLAGTIGGSAAESMSAFLSLEKEIISTEDVLADPEGVELPEKPAAAFMMMFNAIDTVDTQDDLSKFIRFIKRLKNDELRSIFFTMLMRTTRTIPLGKNNSEVNDWYAKNYQFM